MKLVSYLDKALIFREIVASDMKDAIEKMVDLIAKEDKIVAKSKDRVKEAVIKREQEISTAMGNMLAIPHARLDNFEEFIVAIGVLKDPITAPIAGTKENGEVKLLIMIIADNLKNKNMLKIMSGFSKVALKHHELIDGIIECGCEDQVYELFKESNIEVGNRISSEDVLCPELKPVHPNDTLETVAKRLIVEDRTGLPVVDNEGHFLGEITEKELIEYGMPKYLSAMKDASFITIGEPFEEYLKNEKTQTIDSLYRKEGIVTIDRGAPILEICFHMVNKGKTRIYVVENGKYYGMIQRSDIIRKVLHV